MVIALNMSVPYSNQYLESEVFSADPVKLVRMLYRGALDAIAAARRSVVNGDIAGRSREISRATAIVNELQKSLDRTRGGEIAQNLSQLYDYVGRKLAESNINQTEAPLIEAQQLMATLLEAWAEPVEQPVSSRLEYSPVSCAY